MAEALPTIDAKRILIYMPTWLGDCVMATPTLRALRGLYPQAHLAALVKAPMKPLLDGLPWVDRLVTIRSPRAGCQTNRRRGACALAARLKSQRYDLAVLLPNSFRSALNVYLAGIPRRLGYERDWRGMFLTDQLKPLRRGLGFVPDPTLNYYMKIAEHLGVRDADRTMKLFTRKADDERACALLERVGYRCGGGRLLVLLNPGANKIEKRWAPAKFAELGDRCAKTLNAVVAVTGAPRERELVEAVIAQAKTPMVNLLQFGMNLRLLKSVIRQAGLVVTNDTGPRHIAAAMDVPVVTLFGPTPPEWTTIHFASEREIYAPSKDVNDIAVPTAFGAIEDLLGQAGAAA